MTDDDHVEAHPPDDAEGSRAAAGDGAPDDSAALAGWASEGGPEPAPDEGSAKPAVEPARDAEHAPSDGGSEGTSGEGSPEPPAAAEEASADPEPPGQPDERPSELEPSEPAPSVSLEEGSSDWSPAEASHEPRRGRPWADHAASSRPVEVAQAAEDAIDGARVELFVLRHADAGDPMAWQGSDDVRPLSPRGRKQSKRLARFLDATGFEVDAVVSSPKLRALETAKLVAKRVDGKVKIDDRLAYGVGLGTVEAILRELDGTRRVMLVGHDPDFSELVALLCDWPGFGLRKGALARIDVTLPLRARSGDFRWLVPPDLLRADEKEKRNGRH